MEGLPGFGTPASGRLWAADRERAGGRNHSGEKKERGREKNLRKQPEKSGRRAGRRGGKKADRHGLPGQALRISLGVGKRNKTPSERNGTHRLPEGYEAHVVPRSSTYKNFGIIQTNHQAVIDESYCGDNDQWFYPAYALRDTVINKNDRICQFRIMKKMEPVDFIEVDELKDKDRGGIGSTGTN